MPRYQTDSPTSVVETLGLRPGSRVWVGGHNVEAKEEIEKHLSGTDRPPTGPLDLALIAPQTADEALYFAGKLSARLVPGAIAWVIYPNPRSAADADPAARASTAPSQPLTASLADQLDELTVGMFERGFGEAGRGALSDQFSMTGFRLERSLDEF